MKTKTATDDVQERIYDLQSFSVILRVSYKSGKIETRTVGSQSHHPSIYQCRFSRDMVSASKYVKQVELSCLGQS